MYLLVNEDDIIVGSAMNKPSEAHCSAVGQRVFEIDRREYSPEMIGQKLVDFQLFNDNDS